MATRARTETTRTVETTPSYRHLCGWCGRDFGALWQGSQHHSYAICDTCKRVYFASLYEPVAVAAPDQERAAA
jgi:hypothetical protein